MRPAINLFVEIRAVVLACAVMAVLSITGCVPEPVDTAVVMSAPTMPDAVNDVIVVKTDAAEPASAPMTQSIPVEAPADVTDKVITKTVNEPHPRAGQHKHVLIQQSRHVWGLNAPVSSFAAQIHQESRWNPSAKSPVGAAGLTQFMPATARWIGTYDAQLTSVDVYNPRWAMRALAVYDKFLYDKVSGVNPCERMAFALSAYNGGLGWVNKRKARSDAPNVCFGATCEINPGITASNQRENSNYPKLILKQFEPLYVRAGWGDGACSNKQPK